MFKENILGIAIFAVITTGVAHAAIYKGTDAQGNVVYSDSPSKNAKPVDLPPLSIVPSLSPEQIAQATTDTNATGNKSSVVRYQLSFVQPVADQVVRKPDSVGVNVNIQPALANGDVLTILLDGTVIANGNSATISTEDMDRGSHTLTARVMNQAGRIVSETGTTVNVQQTSINSPANQAKKHR